MNEIKKTVGLSYEPGQDRLPRLVLKATGESATIVERDFKKHKPYGQVVRDPELVSKLFSLPTESEISPDLYELVATLLVYVFSIEAKLKESLRNG